MSLSAALEAIAASRFADAAEACAGLSRTAAGGSAEYRASIALAELARRAGGPRGDAVVHVGRPALDELLGALPLDLRVRCEGAYYAAMTPVVGDRESEARELSKLLRRCSLDAVGGTAPLYLSLAKLYYGCGNFAQARLAAERGLVEVERTYDPRTGIRLWIQLGFALAAQHERTTALELIENQIGRAFSLGFIDELCAACSAAMYVLALLDRFDEAMKWGEYALDQRSLESPVWIAILSRNVAAIDLQSGRPKLVLSRLEALRSARTLRPLDEAMIDILRIFALAHTDRYDDAATLMHETLRRDAPTWVRLELRNAEALLYELDGRLEEALDIASLVMRQQVSDSNSLRSKIAAGGTVARLRYRLGSNDFAEPLETLEPLCDEYAMARTALQEASAFAALSSDPTGENATALLSATESNHERFVRALNRFEAAKIARERDLFSTVAAEFVQIGSRLLAERVRAEAAACGLALSPRIARRAHLTQREAELAHHVALGKTNAEIAKTLGLSTKTVDNHVSNILGKCGARSRVEIAVLVLRGKLPVQPA